MASTFSNLGLNLQATGENSGTWGELTNVNLQEIDNAIAGVVTITLTGNTTLAFTSNSSSTTFTDQAGRNKTIILSGSLSATTVTVTVPNIEKDYVIINNSGGTATISSQRLAHSGQEELSKQCLSAVKLPFGDGGWREQTMAAIRVVHGDAADHL